MTITPPDWLAALAPADLVLPTDLDRARFVVGLAVENVERRTGGPFGAAVFESATGRLVAAGVNSVSPARQPGPARGGHGDHGRVRPGRRVQARVRVRAGQLVRAVRDVPRGDAVERRPPAVVYAATRDDAAALGFEEGPVFPESYAYLAARGVEVVPGVGRAEAAKPVRAVPRTRRVDLQRLTAAGHNRATIPTRGAAVAIMRAVCPGCGAGLKCTDPAGFTPGEELTCPKCDAAFKVKAAAVAASRWRSGGRSRRWWTTRTTPARGRSARRDDDEDEDDRPRKKKKRAADRDEGGCYGRRRCGSSSWASWSSSCSCWACC